MNIFILSAILSLSASCSKTEMKPSVTADDYITFYMKQVKTEEKGTRAVLDDLETMIRNNDVPPIYVTEENNSIFDNTRIVHNQKGIWKSDQLWNKMGNTTQAMQYSFFAYMLSPTPGTASTNAGTVRIRNDSQGRNITITEPRHYSDSPEDWADFLMSYKVPAEGKEKPLVQLEMERATCLVELYMTRSPRMTDVIVDEMNFKNLYTKADLNLSYHANHNEGNIFNGMKNNWITILDPASRTNYDHRPAGGKHLEPFNGKDRFLPEHKVMSFMALGQKTIPFSDISQRLTLEISYKVMENGQYKPYTSTFNLWEHDPDTWRAGHRIRYYVSIDSSIELEGVVEKWQEVDFIEGVLLPD